MSSTFGEKLKSCMAQQGLGVRELAELAGDISAGHISNLRNGTKHPSPEVAAELDMLLKADGDLAAAAEQRAPRSRAPRRRAGITAAGTDAGGVLALHPADDVAPLDHFERVLRTTGESDNLFGPLPLVDTVRHHIALITRMRHGKSGKDAAGLLRMQARFAEQLGWLLQDSAAYRDAAHWLDKSLQWALMAGDTDWAAYTLARQSQLAGDQHDPASAVDLAAAADRMASGPTRLSAAGAAFAAHGHALAGNRSAALRDLDTADEITDRPEDHPEAPWAVWLNPGYVRQQRARSLDVLGDHSAAAVLYAEAVAGTSPALRRDRGVYLAREALAHASAGEMDAAAETGLRAAAIGQDAPSGRIAAELRRLDAAARRAPTAATAGLREAIAAAVAQSRPSSPS